MTRDSYTKEDFAHLIKEAGMKATQGRIAVLETLATIGEPISLDAVAAKVSSVDYVTVYRILKHFAAKGLIYQTDFRSGKAYFEFQGGHHHHHVVCTSCGAREAIDICVEETYAKAAKKTKKFAAIKSHVLEFFGLCKKCS